MTTRSSLCSRVGVVPSALVAVLVALVVALALGQLPRSHPLVPALHFSLPVISRTAPSATTDTIALPGRLPFPGFLTLLGQLPAGETAENGSYEARIPLQHRGLLNLRVTYPDGHHTVGSAEVG